MFRAIVRLSFRFVFLFVAASTLAAGTERPEPPGEAGGFLYEVRRNAPGEPQKMYLYGTLNFVDKDGRPLNAAVEKALKASQRLAVDVDVEDQKAVLEANRKYTGYPDDDDLDRHIPPALWQRILRNGQFYGVDRGLARQVKPWALADYLLLAQSVRLQLGVDYGYESRLFRYARWSSLPVVEFEGFEAQFRNRDAFPEALQVAMLARTLDDLISGKLEHMLRRVAAAWQNSDVAGIEQRLRAMRENEGPEGKAFVERFIDERNQSIADHAVGYMALPGTTFLAVDALNLFGDKGLIRILQKRGYRVEKLIEPAGKLDH